MFDHDVDEASVASRLHLQPKTSGSVAWLNGHELVYEHPTLQTATSYEVILEAGYRDLGGNVYGLRHHWSFVTEAPPSLASSSPANLDTGIDPADYLSLDFTREMNAASLRSAVTIYPEVPFAVRLDPGDARRAIVAPSALLAPATDYQIGITTAALDIDGNPLDRDQTVTFTTGAVRPLHRWIAFATQATDGLSGGLWIVNEGAFPRRLFDASSVRSFSWSPGGDSLMIQGDGETWTQFTPGIGPVTLPIKGTWAAELASGLGYVYIDDSENLHHLSVDGTDETIAGNVVQAAVAPNGLRVAFIHGATDPNEVWGYDVTLRVRYQLAEDTASVSGVSWAPSGNRIAYLRDDPGGLTLRMRNLAGAAATTTVATGDLGPPSWLPDSVHVVFAAGLSRPNGTSHKAFVVSAVSPPASLAAVPGLPADPAVDVTSPVPSPDGHQIAFLSGDQVWLMNADGTRPTALTRLDAESFPYSCLMPAWTRT